MLTAKPQAAIQVHYVEFINSTRNAEVDELAISGKKSSSEYPAGDDENYELDAFHECARYTRSFDLEWKPRSRITDFQERKIPCVG